MSLPSGCAIIISFILSVNRPPSGWTVPNAADAERLRAVMLPAALPPFRIQARLIADQQLVIALRFSSFTMEAERDPPSIKTRVEGFLLSESPGATGVARALLRSSICTAQLLGEVSVIDEQESLALREPTRAEPPLQQPSPVPSAGKWAEGKAAPFEHRARAPKPPKREVPKPPKREVEAAPFEHRGRAPKPQQRERANIPDMPSTGTPLDILFCFLALCMVAANCVGCLYDLCERPEHVQEATRS